MADTKLTGRLVALAAAVLIGALALGSWWAWGRDLPLADTGRPLAGEDGRYPSDPLAVAEIGGAEENYARVNSMAGVRRIGMLTEEEFAVYERHDAGRTKVSVANFTVGKASILLVQMGRNADATAAVRELAELQRGYGFRDTEAPDGVHAGILQGDAEPGGRAHYVHEDIVVRVELRGPDRPQVRDKFIDVLRAQARTVIPDG